jgi:hypothetical protein
MPSRAPRRPAGRSRFGPWPATFRRVWSLLEDIFRLGYTQGQTGGSAVVHMTYVHAFR